MNTTTTFNRALIAAGLVGLLGAGAAFGQSAPSGEEPKGSGASAKSESISIVRSDGDDGERMEIKTDSDTLVLEEKDGQPIVKLNGKLVKPEQFSRANGMIIIKDDAGKTLFEHELPDMKSMGGDAPEGGKRFYWHDGGNDERTKSRTFTFRAPSGGRFDMKMLPDDVRMMIPREVEAEAVAAEPKEPPKAMAGVSLAQPSADLLQHLGYKAEDGGTLIGNVTADLPAAQAGLKPFDLIIKIEGKDMPDEEEVREAIRAKNPGDEVKVTVVSKGQTKEVSIKLIAYDASKLTFAGKDSAVWRGMPGVEGMKWNLLPDDARKAREHADEARHEAELARKGARDAEKQAREIIIKRLGKDGQTLKGVPMHDENRIIVMGGHDGEGADMEDRLERMQRQLNRLEDMLDRLERRADRGSDQGGDRKPAPSGGPRPQEPGERDR